MPLAVRLANLPGAPPQEMPSFASDSLTFSNFAPLVVQSQSASEAPGPFVGTAALTFVPVATHVFPTADDAVTNEDTPVAVFIGVASLLM